MPSSKQYKARYGLKPRKKTDKVFALRQRSVKCPFCTKHAVNRLSAGIWYCTRCYAKFTGGAYGFHAKDYVVRVNEAAFLADKKETTEENLEGFDEEQEVEF